MFKGKKSLYVLLPINLLVWGFIGYKIYTSFAGEDLPQPLDISGGHVPAIDKDTVNYELTLNYEDPFLKQEPVKKLKQFQGSAPAVVPVLAITPKKIPVATPAKEIKYLGVIQNKSSGVTMAMISINGNSHMIKKGDVVEGISVKNISPSMIEIKDGKQTLKITK